MHPKGGTSVNEGGGRGEEGGGGGGSGEGALTRSKGSLVKLCSTSFCFISPGIRSTRAHAGRSTVHQLLPHVHDTLLLLYLLLFCLYM